MSAAETPHACGYGQSIVREGGMKPVMKAVDSLRLGVHQHASVMNDRDTGRLGAHDRVFRLGALLHPQVFDAESNTVIDDIQSLMRRDNRDHGLDRLRQMRQRTETGAAFDHVRIGIDREDVESTLEQSLKYGIAKTARARNADDGNVMLSKKRLDARQHDRILQVPIYVTGGITWEACNARGVKMWRLHVRLTVPKSNRRNPLSAVRFVALLKRSCCR